VAAQGSAQQAGDALGKAVAGQPPVVLARMLQVHQ
jgi:hypothetical protein